MSRFRFSELPFVNTAVTTLRKRAHSTLSMLAKFACGQVVTNHVGSRTLAAVARGGALRLLAVGASMIEYDVSRYFGLSVVFQMSGSVLPQALLPSCLSMVVAALVLHRTTPGRKARAT